MVEIIDNVFESGGRFSGPPRCKCPNIGGSVQTRSLQVDLLQVPIHPNSLVKDFQNFTFPNFLEFLRREDVAFS